MSPYSSMPFWLSSVLSPWVTERILEADEEDLIELSNLEPESSPIEITLALIGVDVIARSTTEAEDEATGVEGVDKDSDQTKGRD